MNGKTIMLGVLIIGISLALGKIGIPYSYIVTLIGTAVIVLGLLSKKSVS